MKNLLGVSVYIKFCTYKYIEGRSSWSCVFQISGVAFEELRFCSTQMFRFTAF